VQHSTPAVRQPTYAYNYEYAAITDTVMFAGVMAVSTTNTGSSSTGSWNYVTAANGAYYTQGTSEWYYPSASDTTTARTLLLGAGSQNSFNQRLYPNGQTNVDEGGISFTALDGTQVIISYTNGTYQFTEFVGSVRRTISGRTAGVEVRRISSTGEAAAQCSPPPQYSATAPITCPAGSTEILLGQDEREIANKMYDEEYYYTYANQVYMREVVAQASDIELRQISFLANPLPRTIARVRMAILTRTVVGTSVYQLVAQTNEITVANMLVPSTIRGNLITPVTLTRGQNYTIAFVSDVGLYCPIGYWKYPVDSHLSDTYDFVVGNGFPSSLLGTNGGSDQPTIGARGCILNSAPVSYSFCAAYVYASDTKVYQGVITTVAQDQTSTQGTYRPIVGGYGTSYLYNSGDEAHPEIYNFTVNNFDLFVNNRLYTSAQGASAVDDFGFAVLTTNEWDAYAAQISSFVDPNSASRELMERKQYFYSTYFESVKNLVSSFTYQPYLGGAVPICGLPPRPANLVTPASVARVVCPNIGNSIADVFGDPSVGDFANNADGTTVAANRVYTQSFTPENNAVIRQLVVGILNNADQTPTINIRMGLYAVANNSLIVQTAQLALYQAIDQMIVINLPFSVNVVAGQSYYIALFADNTLEVATSAVANSPSMTATYGTSGLPTTFTSSGNAVSVSIAAFACVDATHAFCGYAQHYNPTSRISQTYLYQGLIQADPISHNNAAGTYLSIYAAAGRMSVVQRESDYPSNTVTVQTYSQSPGTSANYYTSGNNGQQIDSTGLSFTTADGSIHTIKLVNNVIQVVPGAADMSQIRVLFTGFAVTSLSDSAGIPACGLQSVPSGENVLLPNPSCGTGELVTYGTSNPFGVRYSTEGSTSAYPNRIYTRPLVTGAGKPSIITQIQFGILNNPNTFTRMRAALYNSNGTLLSDSREMELINPVTGSYSAALNTPQYLEPSTSYFMAVWINTGLYAGYDTAISDSIEVGFDGNTWPAQFSISVGKIYGDNQRAIGAVGCTTNPIVVSTSSARVSSSSTAVPTPQASSTAEPSSSTGSAVINEWSNSNSANLSSGAVAGLVIGCVIGANLLLLACFYFFCLSTAAVGGKPLNHTRFEDEPSRVSDPSKIEMGELTSDDQE
jgi:hypothetical protein